MWRRSPVRWPVWMGEHREDPPVVPGSGDRKAQKDPPLSVDVGLWMGRSIGHREEGLKGRRSDLTGRKRGPGVIIPCFVPSLRRGKSLTSIIVLEMFHDSHGAKAFVLDCIRMLRQELPWVKIEIRMDSAFLVMKS